MAQILNFNMIKEKGVNMTNYKLNIQLFAAGDVVNATTSKESRNDTERFIAVNGERILVQTGKSIEIPERFAEVIKNSEKMAAVSAEYIDKNISL